MKLYLVHCGFYDMGLCDGIYESHVNLLIAAESFERAKVKVRENPDFIARKMHIDGLQEVAWVNGYQVGLSLNPSANGKTLLLGNRHRDL
ncbi:MAG: hypothetical protein ACJ763_06710 [Bdellovibrionia bacterium]